MDTLQGQKANILIVDDVAPNLMILSAMIQQAGHMPRPVISVEEAMRAIDAMLPDLILLDISMPNITGFEYCKMLKKDSKTQDIPIIFISAKDSTADKQEGFRLGASDFITRPFETEEVIVRVNNQLGNYRLKREMEQYNKHLQLLAREQLVKLKENQQKLVQALVQLNELGSRKPSGHTERMVKNCRRLALGLQLSPKYENIITEDFVEMISSVAALHDIGNMAVGDEILCKTGILTDEERQKMQLHTIRGAEVLKSMNNGEDENDYLRMAEEIAHYHHERYDGSGYPTGKKGEEIPIAARIVAIVDVYSALLQDYSYRPAYTAEESMKIMMDLRGTWFDPDIMQIFYKMQKQLQH